MIALALFAAALLFLIGAPAAMAGVVAAALVRLVWPKRRNP
jgi:hypothetical protein